MPIGDVGELRRELSALSECVTLRRRGVKWWFNGLADPTETIARLRVEGASLDPLAILQTARLCEQAMSARAAILAERENAPVLWQLVENLPRELNTLVARVTNKILPSGELDDRASPELASIRHEINVLRSRITRSLEGLMRRSAEAIQDELVTIRNDRFVIPVKSDHRARVNGVAHGYSSSGATAFVEPLETIEEGFRALHTATHPQVRLLLSSHLKRSMRITSCRDCMRVRRVRSRAFFPACRRSCERSYLPSSWHRRQLLNWISLTRVRFFIRASTA